MRKLTALALSIAVMIGLINCTVIYADAGIINEEQKTLLSVVGIYDEGADLNKPVTRGEFVQMLSKIAFEIGAQPENYITGLLFNDVKSGNKYYGAANALYGRGYIKADKFGCFYPEKILDTESAFEMVIGTLGYSALSSDGAFPYTSFASDKDLTKGMVFNANDEVTVYNAYILLFNMLKTDISDLSILKEDKTPDELIYMTKRLGLYEIKGIVTDDGKISMYGDSQIAEGMISIDNGEALINKSSRNDLFGLNAGGYFIEDNGEYILLGAYERENKNNIYVMLSENIESYDNRTYSYYSDEFSGSVKRVKIPKEAVIVYNERTLRLEDNFDNSMFVPENGIVRLYDNNSDGDIDVVKIENYETQIVQYVNTKQENIYLQNEKPYIALQDKEYEIYGRDGTKMELQNISAGNVISVMESIGGEHYKILVSDYTENETVVSFSAADESGPGYVGTLSGGKYELSKYAGENYKVPELNTRYKFMFDAFDKVAGYTKDVLNLDWQYGYLIWIRQNDQSAEEEYFAKIYTAEGEFELITLNEKVKVLDQHDDSRKYDAQAVEATIDYTGVIRYKVNQDELITNIELPKAYGTKPDSEDRLYYILDTVNGNKDDYYTKVIGKTINFGGAAVLTENTTVFSVPSDLTKAEDYSIGNSTSFVNGEKYALYAYGTNYKSKNAECVVLNSSDSQGVAITNETPIYIKSVYRAYDESKNEAVYQLTCADSKGEEKIYYMEDEVYKTKVKAIAAGNTEPIQLGAGDIIYYSLNNNYIISAVALYDADQYVTDEKGGRVEGSIAGTKISYYSPTETLCSPFSCGNYTAGNPGSESSWKFYGGNVRIWVGWVYSYEDGYMLITNQNPEYGYDYSATKQDGLLTEAAYFNSGIATAATVNSKGKVSISKAGEADIKPYNIYGADCSKIVLTMRVYDQRSIHLINFE